MKRIRILILFIVCLEVSASGSYIPEHTESYGLYHTLNLSETVSFPAFRKALEGYAKYREHGDNSLLVLIDFTKPSTEKRFCVVDLEQKKVLFSSYVAHGRASGENYAVSFSNRPGSHKSSLGFYRTGNTYIGKNGYSLFLDGLEQGVNDKARERAIVIHGADYADPIVLKKQNRLGRSLGCPALPPAVSSQIIDTIKNGSLLYIYGKNQV